MKICGTEGRKVVVARAISGRLVAAAMNFCVFWKRNAMSFPARSSSRKVTPPEVPMPGMAGGEKAKATPWGSLLSLAFSPAKRFPYFSSELFRSPQGFRVTKKNPL